MPGFQFAKPVYSSDEIPLLLSEIERQLVHLVPTREVNWWCRNCPGRIVGAWPDVRDRMAAVIANFGNHIQPSSIWSETSEAIQVSVLEGGVFYQTILFRAEDTEPDVYTFIYYT